MKAVYVEYCKPAARDGFDAWYGTHAASLQKIRGVTKVLGHYWGSDVGTRGTPPYGPHLALYELDAPQDALAGLATELQGASRKSLDGHRQGEGAGVACAVYSQIAEIGDNAAAPGSVFMVFTDATSPAQDAEYNKWYDDIHLPDLMRIPGFFAATRYRATVSGNAWPYQQQYLAIYKMSAKSDAEIETASAGIAKRRATPDMVISPALNQKTTKTNFYLRAA